MEANQAATAQATKNSSVLKWLLIALAVSVAGFLICAFSIYSMATKTYNTYSLADEANNAKWAEVTNQYQRRSDLIPSLVATVQGEANFEKSTLTDVINARSKASSVQLTAEALKDPAAMQQFSQRQGDITTALQRMMSLTENYPNLKANQAFRDLHAQLEGTENRITVARNRYIEGVNTQNAIIRVFPGNVVAGFFNLHPRAQFTVENAAAISTAPKIEFSK